MSHLKPIEGDIGSHCRDMSVEEIEEYIDAAYKTSKYQLNLMLFIETPLQRGFKINGRWLSNYERKEVLYYYDYLLHARDLREAKDHFTKTKKFLKENKTIGWTFFNRYTKMQPEVFEKAIKAVGLMVTKINIPVMLNSKMGNIWRNGTLDDYEEAVAYRTGDFSPFLANKYVIEALPKLPESGFEFEHDDYGAEKHNKVPWQKVPGGKEKEDGEESPVFQKPATILLDVVFLPPEEVSKKPPHYWHIHKGNSVALVNPDHPRPQTKDDAFVPFYIPN